MKWIWTRGNLIAGLQGIVYGVVVAAAGTTFAEHPWKSSGLVLALIVVQRLR